MEQRKVRTTTPQSEASTQKLPYAPPKATFVPLEVEERLLMCFKSYPVCGGTVNMS